MESNTGHGQENPAEQVTGGIIEIGHLLDYLRGVKDGRKRRGIRYRLEVILALFIMAKLCGENKVYGIADWVQLRSEYLIQVLDLKLKRKRLPHHSTYRRILTDEISADDLEVIFSQYLAQLPRRGQEMVIVIDGKTVRGTITAKDPFGLHLLAAYLPGEGIVLMQMVVEKRLGGEDEEEIGKGRAFSIFVVGAVSLYGALFPVLMAGRDVDFSGGFDKYTLHASPAAAILLVGFLFGFIRGRARQAFLGLLIFLGAATHILNAYHWERFWEYEKALWWQLYWRAPDIKDGTIVLASIPEGGFFEDYEMWGPVNLIYRPVVETVTIGAEVLNSDTIWEVWSGAKEIRSMRGLEYVRDYNKSLLLAFPSDSSCLKVVDREDIILPLRFEARLVPILRFSSVDQIDLSERSAPPPAAIFGPEPAHDWCFYYQSAEQAKQAGDWDAVVRLGDEAIAAGLRPVERAEWLPFLEGYLWAGNEAKIGEVEVQIAADAPLVKEICSGLERERLRFGGTIQQALTQTLCP